MGLTGQTGAGKTQAASIFLDFGFYVINADNIAKNIINKNIECNNKIINFFGDNIVDQDNNIISQKLAKIVFNDKEQLLALNNITFEYIVYEIVTIVNNLSKKYILIDAPLLFESKLNLICNKVLTILSDQQIRAERIIHRDNITKELAWSRISSQNSDIFYTEKSDFIIYNNKTLRNLKFEIKKILIEMKISKINGGIDI